MTCKPAAYIAFVTLLLSLASLPARGTPPSEDTGTLQTAEAEKNPALPPVPPNRPKQAETNSSRYVKKGWSLTPLPALSYSSDLGFQLGAILDAYWFGDGSTYPEYIHKITAEACYFTKGSGIYYLFYDSKFLLKGLRLTASASYLPNTMMAFYGFNGYEAPYIKEKNAGFYAVDRNLLRIMGDLQGKITGNLGWAAGAAYFNYSTGRVKVSKYDKDVTLYDLYRKYGIIDADESGGGNHIELRTGLVYDTRDNEPDPSEGIYADLLLYGSPDIIDRRGHSYLKLSASFRHYIPVIRNRLVIAYRLCWQGTVAGNAPFYIQQNYATLFLKQINSDILGGAISLRGILYNRVVGDAMAWGNAEIRLRLFSFRLLGQEWYVTANPFFDAGIVTRPFRPAEIKAVGTDESIPADVRRTIYSGEREKLHMSAGTGVKIVMNRNLVLSAEYGVPFDRRDGTNGLYLNLNYIF